MAKLDFSHTYSCESNTQGMAGEWKSFATANSRIDTFGHIVSLEALELRTEAMVYFFANEQIKRNLLGRSGWLDRVRFGLVEHDQMLFLSSYDS